MQEYDLVVIGGGSAGLKAARTAARLGKTVAVAEERELGGECFWAGCVPTKAMIRAAQVWHLVERAREFGIEVDIRKADFAAAMAFKERAIQRVAGESLPDGGLSLMGIAYFPTRATFEGPHDIRVGDEVIRGKQIILATGTVPAVPPIPGLAEAGFLTNREAVELKALPKTLVVLGAGPIGLEFAQTYRRFGSEVTVLEVGASILPREDEELVGMAERYLQEEGIRIQTNALTERVDRVNGRKRLLVTHSGITEEIVCDEILIATGRQPAVQGIGIEAAGIPYSRHGVEVDEFQRTCVPHIWAPGDVNGGYLFTHVASYEGKLVANNACTDTLTPRDLRYVPRCTYIDPEVSSIGLTEHEAREKGFSVAIHAALFAANDRAVLYDAPQGIAKIVVNADTGQILGGHLLGHESSSLLAELAVCMRNGVPLSGLADTMHAYPSFPEAIEMAALTPPREL